MQIGNSDKEKAPHRDAGIVTSWVLVKHGLYRSSIYQAQKTVPLSRILSN